MWQRQADQPMVKTPETTFAKEIASLQRLLLPPGLPKIPGYCVQVHYRPCEAAGGDFYGWGMNDGKTLGIGIADVAGHGYRAAVVMAMLRTWIAASRYFNRSGSLIADDLNRFFAEIGDLKTFVTMVLLRFDLETGTFSLRNCGHPFPRIRRRDGTVVSLDQGRGLPLGIAVDEPYEAEGRGQLHPGESLVLFTDGITESVGHDKTFFDDERLECAIAKCDGTAEGIVASIKHEVDSHRGSQRQRDDECILVIARDC
jgi:phosphoserine phosphatase RsbU/P